MMFMVREMYRHVQFSNWKVVFVTDRTQLEQQLSETSQSTGFTVKLADSIKALKKLLSADTSDLVMAMIHKFREEDLTETFPELNASPNILVMTDEAHRSQYKLHGANLDKGVPNAAKMGYTGTPIDKTELVFGDYIDKYTMRQSIEDGVTLEIVYEGRTHNAEVPDQDGWTQRSRMCSASTTSSSAWTSSGTDRGTPISRQSPPSRPKRGTWWTTTSRTCSLTPTRRRWWRRHARQPYATEAPGRRARGGCREAGAGQHGQAGPRPPQGDED